MWPGPRRMGQLGDPSPAGPEPEPGRRRCGHLLFPLLDRICLGGGAAALDAVLEGRPRRWGSHPTTRSAFAMLVRIRRDLGTPCLIHQPSYSLITVAGSRRTACWTRSSRRASPARIALLLGAGPAHRQVPERRAGGQPGRGGNPCGRLFRRRRTSRRRSTRSRGGADRRWPRWRWPAALRGGGARCRLDRREPAGTGGGLRGRASPSRLHGGGTRRDRPLRRGGRRG